MPNIKVRLVGEDGNAFAVLGAVTKALRERGVPPEQIDAFRQEATRQQLQQPLGHVHALGGGVMKTAIYTRYSSDRQREASTQDQLRNCARRAQTEGWTISAHFKDEGISGSRSDRPGYRALLESAKRHEFEVLLMDDLSRLSRDSTEGERTMRRLEFAEW